MISEIEWKFFMLPVLQERERCLVLLSRILYFHHRDEEEDTASAVNIALNKIMNKSWKLL